MTRDQRTRTLDMADHLFVRGDLEWSRIVRELVAEIDALEKARTSDALAAAQAVSVLGDL